MRDSKESGAVPLLFCSTLDISPLVASSLLLTFRFFGAGSDMLLGDVGMRSVAEEMRLRVSEKRSFSASND